MTNSISVIVPTLWAASDFADRIKSIAAVKEVKEIIIIDNNNSSAKNVAHKKIKILVQNRNIFVNPAWNLGANCASGDILCFLNDDLDFKIQIFSYAANLFDKDLKFELGLVGLDWIKPLGEFEQKYFNERSSPGFGCIMFIRAKEFRQIPGVIKIWHGDDFMITIAILTGKRVIGISGYSTKEQAHSVSTNSIRTSINSILKNDSIWWNRYIRRFLFLRYGSWTSIIGAIKSRIVYMFFGVR